MSEFIVLKEVRNTIVLFHTPDTDKKSAQRRCKKTREKNRIVLPRSRFMIPYFKPSLMFRKSISRLNQIRENLKMAGDFML